MMEPTHLGDRHDPTSFRCLEWPWPGVAVGTAVARCPPHRPVLALLAHTVPTLDVWRRSAWLPAHGPAPLACFPDSVFGPGFVGPCSPWSAAFPPQPPLAVSRLVRLLRRYYATVRLPATVPGGLMAHRFLPPVRGFPAAHRDGVSRFSRVEFLCLRGVFDSAGPRCTRATAHRVIAFG